jgi:ABC-type bacteriocin/lantibiotic exporter with double-glycine peptidase domain
MKPVVQNERTGCGIASVAALAGVSYGHAKAQARRIGISADDPKLWSDTRYVRTLLSKFGISASRKEQGFRSWEKLPDLSLLAIKWHLENDKPCWHWVVFVREEESSYVLDPKRTLKKNKRTDFGRMKPKWFIEVYA